jgi:hypothetical protein
MSSFVNPIAQAVGSTIFAAILLCLGAAILHADEARPLKTTDGSAGHCRIYFGCLPAFTKERGRLNESRVDALNRLLYNCIYAYRLTERRPRLSAISASALPPLVIFPLF